MVNTALASITLMIENVLGLYISLPRKTVDWIMPTLEIMGIEDLSLKRNMITILSNKSARGWEVRLESEKLYYFTINILDEDKKKHYPSLRVNAPCLSINFSRLKRLALWDGWGNLSEVQ